MKRKHILFFTFSLIIIFLLLLTSCGIDPGESTVGSENGTEDGEVELEFELNKDKKGYTLVRPKKPVNNGNAVAPGHQGDAYVHVQYKGDVVIPEKYKGMPVTAIGDSAFLLCEELTSVTIPEGIKSIGNSAFDGCSALTEISLPQSLESIGNSAFFGCKNLKKINFSDGLQKIGDFAFHRCTSLVEVVLPESVTTVGGALFCECYSLERCVLSQNITELPSLSENASGAHGLFFDCGSLKEITLPQNITYIPELTFGGCGSLTEIEIPESVREIKGYAISMCHSLTSITIPEGVTVIHEDAIQMCGSLFEVVNKSKVKLKPLGSSGDGIEVFAKSVITNEADSRIQNIDDFIFYMGEDETYLIKYIGEETAVTLPTLDSGEKYTVYSDIFTGVDNVHSLTLPNSIKYINNHAFEHIDNLETLVLNCADAEIESEYFGPNETVKTLYLNVDNDFIPTYFYNLEKVICGEGLTTIKKQEFEGSAVKHIEFPSTLESIEDYAFNQSRLETIIFAPNSSLKAIGNFAFLSTPINEITIPEGVVEIGEECFAHSGVKIIGLPSTLERIGKNAFLDCYMQSIDIPDNVTEISEGAFAHCKKLVTVGIGDESLLESIGYRAFYACESLRAITIPKNVSQLGGAVIGGSKVMTFDVSDENPYFKMKDGMLYSADETELVLCPPARLSDSVTISKNTKRIAPYAFYSCMKVTSVIFEDGSLLESIGDYGFWGCGLGSVTFPESVTFIGKYAFGFCQNLENVDLSHCSITELSEGVFAESSRFSTIFISKNIRRICESAFSWTGITTVTYDGTVAEWEKLEKGDGWDASMGDYRDIYTVVCTDGNVTNE